MKIEVKITDDIGNVEQYVVSCSLVSSNSIQKEAEKYQHATANKMAIERTAFAQGALWVRSLFLHNDRQLLVISSVCSCTRFRETPIINGKHVCSICNKPIVQNEL